MTRRKKTNKVILSILDIDLKFHNRKLTTHFGNFRDVEIVCQLLVARRNKSEIRLSASFFFLPIFEILSPPQSRIASTQQLVICVRLSQDRFLSLFCQKPPRIEQKKNITWKIEKIKTSDQMLR